MPGKDNPVALMTATAKCRLQNDCAVGRRSALPGALIDWSDP